MPSRFEKHPINCSTLSSRVLRGLAQRTGFLPMVTAAKEKSLEMFARFAGWRIVFSIKLHYYAKQEITEPWT